MVARASRARSLIDWGARAPRPLFDAPSRRTPVVLAAGAPLAAPEAGAPPISDERNSPRVKGSWRRTRGSEAAARRGTRVRRGGGSPPPRLPAPPPPRGGRGA